MEEIPIERGVWQECLPSLILFNVYTELFEETFNAFGKGVNMNGVVVKT